MKKINALLILILLYNTSFSQVWNQKLTFPGGSGARYPASFSIPSLGKGYSVGGNNNQTWQYDTSSNSWTQVTPFPGLASGAQVGGSINGLGYIATGTAGGYYFDSTLWEYNPGSQIWTKLAHFPGAPRGYATGFSLGGKFYVGAGVSFNGSIILSYHDFYAYDPTSNTWTQISDCPAQGSQADVGFSIGNKGYVGTGMKIDSNSSSSTPGTPQKDFWEYDPSTNKWTQIADFGGGPRSGDAAFAFCSSAFVGLGDSDANQSDFTTDFWQYNPSINKWTQTANFPGIARGFTCTFAIGNSGFVGMGDAAPTYYDFYEFNIPSAFTPAFSADSSICTGGSIFFIDTSNYAPTNWYWQFSGGKPGTSSADSVTVEYDTAGTYNIILSAWNSCDSGSQTFTKYVTVNQGGILTVTPLSPQVCSGQNVKLIVQGTGSFTWSPSTGLSATIGDSVVINDTATTVYSVTGSGSGGCAFTGTDTVKVISAPALIIKPQDTTICNGSSVTLFAPSSGSGYSWSPAVTLNSIAGDSAIASPTLQTTYTVTGTDSVGCSTTGFDTVSVNKGFNKPIISDTSDLLTSTATQGNQWYKNGVAINGATGESYTATDTGCFYDIATNIANGCSSISNTLCIAKLASINLLTINPNLLSIYPNPTGGELFININSSEADVKDWNLQVTDVLGRRVYTKLSLNYSNDIDLSDLPSGVYFITLIDKSERAVFPVVKQNY